MVATTVSFFTLAKRVGNVFSSPYVFKTLSKAKAMEEVIAKKDTTASYKVIASRAVLDDRMLADFESNVHQSLTNLNRLKGMTNE